MVVAVQACGRDSSGSASSAKPSTTLEKESSGKAGGPAVWAVGDGADGKGPAKALARLIAARGVDRFLYLGDVYEHGTASDFARNYASVFGRFASKTAPTPGNHDWPGRVGGYDRYWRSIRGKGQSPYYSFSVGGWQILSLNSEAPHDKGSPQLAWLRREVRGGGTCRLAFWHRPRYSDGTEHGDQRDVAPFWEALRGKATLVLNGHEHDMQRFKPREGITELVSGAGGHGHYPLRPGPRLAFGNDENYGALRVGLRPGGANLAFVSAAGRTLDSARVACRR